MFQFNIVFGIVVAFASNALLAGIGENAWRWMLGIAVIPSAVYTVLCLGIPESPRWLLSHRRDREAAIGVLQLMDPDASREALETEANRLLPTTRTDAVSEPFWSRKLMVPIGLAFLVAFFNQLSGINAILYFAPRIFAMTGLGPQAALLQSVGIGITNLLFTFVGIWLIDRCGRRTLLLVGSFGYIASLGLTSWAFFTGHFGIVPSCIFAFIAAHAVGQGAVIWVLISEVFPDRHRAAGQALGSFTHWIFAALLTTFFPAMIARFVPGQVFLFFCGMMALQLAWVWFLVPETRGLSLEAIQERLGIRPASKASAT